MKKSLALLLVFAMLLCSGIAAIAETTEFPRSETFYVFDHWGSINGWSPIGTNMNNGLAISSTPMRRCTCTTPPRPLTARTSIPWKPWTTTRW